MIIVIPMAGMSSRFFKEGYDKPKYMLSAHGRTLFEHSVGSFQYYFKDIQFLFIIRNNYNTANFVREKAMSMGIKKFFISILDEETRGQAETVALGLREFMSFQSINDSSIIIFNIDSFRPGFVFPEQMSTRDGYLEVFKGDGHNWSFAKPLDECSTEVARTAEKDRISELCSTGLYYFASFRDYLSIFDEYVRLPKFQWEQGELYVAPLYNLMINNGKKIHYHLIERSEVIFCGVPSEYVEFVGMDISNESL